jgi:HPt (histidine-containing phosphotransfer) domain-containing protein
MSENTSDEQRAVQAKVDLMAKVFLGRLPVRFEKMNETFALCVAVPFEDAGWIELHRQLHSLAGAAGTFGCDDLGEQAALIEMLLKDLVADKVRSAADIDDIARLLTMLQSST